MDQQVRETDLIFLESILHRNHGFAKQLDTYANIMIALSSAIFIFSFSQLREGQSLFWMILGMTTGLSTILSLLMIRPPKLLRKKGQEESLMYGREIAGFKSARDYQVQLNRALQSRGTVLREYSKEIYNVTKYYYHPKKLLFRISKGVLLLGMSISLVLFVIEYFF